MIAGVEHFFEGGQVVVLLDDLPSCGHDGGRAEIGQGFEPQALGLIEQHSVVKGGVKLVVIINAEQGEDLIDGVY